MASGGRSSTAKSSKNKAKTTAVKKNTSPAGKRKRTTKAKQQAANQLREKCWCCYRLRWLLSCF